MVTVRVTKEMIEKNRHCVDDCPVAEAMIEAGISVYWVMPKWWNNNTLRSQ